jgi:hypothetical protein
VSHPCCLWFTSPLSSSYISFYYMLYYVAVAHPQVGRHLIYTFLCFHVVRRFSFSMCEERTCLNDSLDQPVTVMRQISAPRLGLTYSGNRPNVTALWFSWFALTHNSVIHVQPMAPRHVGRALHLCPRGYIQALPLAGVQC